jgi:hypothetical protein
MPDLSILIPSCNEEFLPHTVRDLLAHFEADSEIIVVINGTMMTYTFPEDPRLRVLKYDAQIGQRAAQNVAARASSARYVMKMDAHCAIEPGFDRKMIAAMQAAGDDVTLVPTMRNLDVFWWVCDFCGWHRGQGPKPEQCDECNADATHFEKKIIWNPKPNPSSTAYRFTNTLQFKYFDELHERHKREGRTGLRETMSLQGSCFMAARAAYWERELCDESWGNWGQQGSEVALKTWLSGGRVLCTLDTYYAHLFRTQKGFGFPFGGVNASQEKARRICQDIFLNDKWPKQTRPLAWLLDRFWDLLAVRAEALMPVRSNYPGNPDGDKKYNEHLDDWNHRWTQVEVDRLKARGFRGATLPPSKGMIYYTDNQLPETIAAPVRERLLDISRAQGLPITTAALGRRLKWGTTNIYFHSLKRGPLAMFKQILGALENSRAEIVFFCEHDVLYDLSHFEFTPPDRTKLYYNLNLWQVRASDGHAVYWDAKRVSQLCGYRDVLIEHYRKRVAKVEANGYSMAMGYEPASHNRAERVDDLQSDTWRSAQPNYDLKHGHNLSPTKWTLADFRTAPTGWQEVERLDGWVPLGVAA